MCGGAVQQTLNAAHCGTNDRHLEKRLLRLPQAKNYNYRDPYDRVIRCLGWRADFGSMFEEAPAMMGEYEEKVRTRATRLAC